MLNDSNDRGNKRTRREGSKFSFICELFYSLRANIDHKVKLDFIQGFVW
jgi:hypothetical protein